MELESLSKPRDVCNAERHQTKDLMRKTIAVHVRCKSFYISLPTCIISNTRDSVSSNCGLKICWAAYFFWRNSRYLDSPWNAVSSVWYIFSIEKKMSKRRRYVVKIYTNKEQSKNAKWRRLIFGISTWYWTLSLHI